MKHTWRPWKSCREWPESLEVLPQDGKNGTAEGILYTHTNRKSSQTPGLIPEQSQSRLIEVPWFWWHPLPSASGKGDRIRILPTAGGTLPPYCLSSLLLTRTQGSLVTLAREAHQTTVLSPGSPKSPGPKALSLHQETEGIQETPGWGPATANTQLEKYLCPNGSENSHPLWHASGKHHHSRNQDNSAWVWKQSMATETQMSQILESTDKDFKASVIKKKCFRKLLQILLNEKKKMSAMGVCRPSVLILLLSCTCKLHR